MQEGWTWVACPRLRGHARAGLRPARMPTKTWACHPATAISRKQGLGPPSPVQERRAEPLGVRHAALQPAEPGEGLGQLDQPGQAAVRSGELALVAGEHPPLELERRGDVDQVRRLEAD